MSANTPSQRTGNTVANLRNLGTVISSNSRYHSDYNAVEDHINSVITANPSQFAPILSRCPLFPTVLSHSTLHRFGYRVQQLPDNSNLLTLTLEDARLLGRSMQTLIRMRKTGETAVDAWRRNYAHVLSPLFEDVVGFEEFMVEVATILMRDNIYGMASRVALGAILSSLDAATDIYTIVSYFKKGLRSEATLLLVMCASNLVIQILIVLACK